MINRINLYYHFVYLSGRRAGEIAGTITSSRIRFSRREHTLIEFDKLLRLEGEVGLCEIGVSKVIHRTCIGLNSVDLSRHGLQVTRQNSLSYVLGRLSGGKVLDLSVVHAFFVECTRRSVGAHGILENVSVGSGGENVDEADVLSLMFSQARCCKLNSRALLLAA